MQLRTTLGLAKDVADELHDILTSFIKESLPNFPELEGEHAFYKLPIPQDVMNALRSKNIEMMSKQLATRSFNTKIEYLSCEMEYGIAYPKHKKSIIHKAGESTENMVVVILALGDLSKNKGLPAFQGTVVPLESGMLLAAPLSAQQKFDGNDGGGLGYVWIWSCKPTEPAKPTS